MTHMVSAARSCLPSKKHTWNAARASYVRGPRCLFGKRIHQTLSGSIESVRCQSADAEHSRYLRVHGAVVEGLEVMPALVSVLQALGGTLIDPADRSDMNPLLIPIVKNSDGSVVAMLRLPQTRSVQEMAVVKTRPQSTYIQLLARRADEFIHRAMAEEDWNNAQMGISDRPIATAAGEYGAALYEQNSVATSGLPSLNAYLARKVGMFLDVCEELVQAHLDKGDPMSGLITAEWYMRDGQFPNWGKPYEYVSDLMISTMNRKEEGRDIARLALKTPWWTLEKGFEHIKATSGLTGDADSIRKTLLEQEEMANVGALQGKYKTNPKSNEEERIEEASHLLNKVVAGECSWADIRPELEAKYELAGLIDMARFIAII